jgi:hypothetical protein
MNDFKAGDRVEYTGATSKHKAGLRGTVSRAHGSTIYVNFDDGSDCFGAFSYSLTKLTAPDVITIVRADLPEVTVDGQHLLAGKNIFGRFLDADGHRKMALSQLAVAEYMEAEERTKAKPTKRRDELAKVVAKNADWVGWRGALYVNHSIEARAAIDMMIVAEANRG